MAASVQELILAAQAKQRQKPASAVADLIRSGSRGYAEGLKMGNEKADMDYKRAQIAQQLIMNEQLKREAEAQAQAQRQLLEEDLMLQSERGLRMKQGQVAPERPGYTPAGKVKTTISVDERGKRSKVTVYEPSESETSKLPEGYRVKPDGNMEMIPGGPADVRTRLEREKMSIESGQIEQKKKEEALEVEVPGFINTGKTKVSPAAAEKYREGVASLNQFLTSLSSYKGKINKYGTQEITDRRIQGEMKADAKALQLEIKNLAQLGVLSASDIPYIAEQIPDPGFFKTKEGMLGALDATETRFKSKVAESMKARGYEPSEEMKSLLMPAKSIAKTAPTGKIRVIRIKDNQPGYISESNFDPQKYRKE